jgi:hypothetical protein
LTIEVPQILGVDLVLELRHFVSGFVGIVHGEFVVAIELRLLLGHAFHDIAHDVPRRIELRFLWQIADGHSIRGPGLAGELLLLSRHNAQQRRLARAVDADHADLGAGEEGERHVLQDLFPAGIGLVELVHDVDVLRGGHGRPFGD